MSIPIKNIYFLLCYAWNKLDEKDQVFVGEDDATDMLDLLARIMISATRHLLLRGLDRSYVANHSIIPGIKGKLNVQASVNGNHFFYGRAECTFDEFSSDILHNQILKTILLRLIRTDKVEDQQKTQLLHLFRRFRGVGEVELSEQTFAKVMLHRNNHFYGFPLKVCELIFQCTIPSEDKGTFVFVDFSRNHLAMAALFEEFVRRFFQIHLAEQFDSIEREDIFWKVGNIDAETKKQIPRMQTDVTLRSKTQKIIIDPKFYHNAVSGNAEKLNPGNLFQLFAYLKNQENGDRVTQTCRGILLYPKTGKALNLNFDLGGHPVSVKTIDLNHDWKEIEAALLEVVS